MKNLLLILASVIILTACKTPKVIEKHYRDSVHTSNTVIQYRDTVIKVQLPPQIKIIHDTVVIYKDGKPWTSNILKAETDFAQAFAQIILGKLTLRIENKEQVSIYLKNAIKETIKELTTSVKNDNKTEKIIEVYKLHWWQSILCWIGGICFFIAILFAALFIILKYKGVK